jgi:hypothetical protein
MTGHVTFALYPWNRWYVRKWSGTYVRRFVREWSGVEWSVPVTHDGSVASHVTSALEDTGFGGLNENGGK